MTDAYRITFCPVKRPITHHSVKFGGQPVWADRPAWPLSRSTGKPMRFVGQIDLSLLTGYEGDAKWAYLFMMDDEHEYVDGIWEPDSGENCLLLQPGNRAEVQLADSAQGPSLVRMVKRIGRKTLVPKTCEFSVDLEAFTENSSDVAFDDSELENKIGGKPAFLQGEEFPGEPSEDWLLALQLDSATVPFSINFGDVGVGYAFVKRDGSSGRFLWQCC